MCGIIHLGQRPVERPASSREVNANREGKRKLDQERNKTGSEEDEVGRGLLKATRTRREKQTRRGVSYSCIRLSIK